MSTLFSDKIITWHRLHGRHDLPWQHPKSCYRVWISEIMLQQTQVKTVIPYYERFIKRFKTLKSLANATEDEVLAYWSGLGYYARARNLHRCAQIIQEKFNGKFPQTISDLCALPGIGRSTAGAILSLACNQQASILDGNVKRILCRVYAIDSWAGETKTLQRLWKLSEQQTPSQETARYNQAMMDLGATICTRQQPNCSHCPINEYCLAYQRGQQSLLPVAKPKKALPHKTTYMLILLNEQQEILLEKRPSTGIWGGLWSLPEYEAEKEISEYIKKYTNRATSESNELNILPSISHQFTHFKLHIKPCLLRIVKPNATKIMDQLQQIWYKNKDISTIGIPKPIRQLLTQIFTTGEIL